jgi:hypothetical protein
MPNWCNQQLTIKGDKQERDRLVALVTTENGYQLTSLHPCPPELMETVRGWTNDEDLQRQHEEQQQRNIDKYGYKDWYDWAYANWDSKWSDCDTELEYHDDYTSFVFQSAWSPMCALITKLSEIFPSLVFGLAYTEEAHLFAGWSVFHEGKFVTSYDHPIDWESCPDWEADPDGHSAWEEEIYMNHDYLLGGVLSTLLLKN